MMRRKLSDIATAITVHLKRLEADPRTRDHSWVDRNGEERTSVRYYWAFAVASGNRVFVTYVSYQGAASLTRDRAEAYLAWLDAGNVGTHYTYEKSIGASK